jgi:hypothetical protein
MEARQDTRRIDREQHALRRTMRRNRAELREQGMLREYRAEIRALDWERFDASGRRFA